MHTLQFETQYPQIKDAQTSRHKTRLQSQKGHLSTILEAAARKCLRNSSQY